MRYGGSLVATLLVLSLLTVAVPVTAIDNRVALAQVEMVRVNGTDCETYAGYFYAEINLTQDRGILYGASGFDGLFLFPCVISFIEITGCQEASDGTLFCGDPAVPNDEDRVGEYFAIAPDGFVHYAERTGDADAHEPVGESLWIAGHAEVVQDNSILSGTL